MTGMKNITIIILLVVLAGLGWYAYDVKRTSSLSIESPTILFSASFACKDGTHFIAEFPDGEDSLVVITPNTALAYPGMEGAGQKFEDDSFRYVFAGEEVTVTNKATNAVTTCSQPFDPNNAPANFGDAAEGGAGFGAGAQADISSIVAESIQGTWKSADDAKFVRAFKSENIVVDSYGGKADATGTWKVFGKATAPKTSFPLEEGVAYAQLTIGSAPAEVYTYKIMKVTPEELELVYMERGNTLRFTKE